MSLVQETDRLSALTALNRTGIAVTCRDCGGAARGSHGYGLGFGRSCGRRTPWGGDRKDREREQRVEERKRRDAAEHDERDVVEVGESSKVFCSSKRVMFELRN